MFLMVGGLLDFASLGFAAQSLVAATGGLTLACNVVFARWVLDEPAPFGVAVGTAVIVAGCSVTVAFSSHQSDSRTGDELADLLKRAHAIIFFVTVNGSILFSSLAVIWVENQSFLPRYLWCSGSQLAVPEATSTVERDIPEESPNPVEDSPEADKEYFENPAPEGCLPDGCMPDLTGCAGDLTNIVADVHPPLSPMIAHKVETPEPNTAAGEGEPVKDGLIRPWKEGMEDHPQIINCHGALHAWISGIAGSQSVLFGKICAEMIRSSVDGHELRPWIFVGSLIGMGLFVWLQLHSMNRGLKYHQTTLIVPAYQTFWTLGGIASGAAIFDEFDNASVAKLVVYPIGMVVMLTGVWSLIKMQQSTQLGHTPLPVESVNHKDVKQDQTGRSILSPQTREIASPKQAASQKAAIVV